MSNKQNDSKGRSIADFLVAILDDRFMFARFLLLITCIGLIVGVMTWLVGKALPSNASEVQIGAAHILFSQSTRTGEKYVVIISPQGWVRTGIQVADSSILTIDADGRVQIDLSGLNKALMAREAAENRVAVDRNEGRIATGVTSDQFAPEDYFTDAENGKMRPTWAWVGPDGVPELTMREHGNPARWRRAVVPSVGYGALVAALDPRDMDPSASPALVDRLIANAFVVGTSYKQKISPQKGGFLYFTVNDVLSNKADFREAFFIDNVGAFFTKIDVSK